MTVQAAADEHGAPVLCLADLPQAPVACLAGRYGIELQRVPDGAPIPGSFWGAPEAGVAGTVVFARGDTPLHSLLHELCHIVCMTPARRNALYCDAGGDDAEECAVCYLQILLADELAGLGSARLMRDMDAWGYSFRLGSAARWFREDAGDARAWLLARSLLRASGRITWRLRQQ